METLPGERVLAAGQAESGEWVLATTARLAVMGEVGDGIVGMWTDVAHVKLEGTTGTLTVEWVGGREPLSVRLGRRHRRVKSVINERVTASMVAARHVNLAGGTVRVAVRRSPDGRLFPQVIAPPTVDLADATVAAEVGRIVASLSDAVGLDPNPTTP
jgi:hypothetical protein